MGGGPGPKISLGGPLFFGHYCGGGFSLGGGPHTNQETTLIWHFKLGCKVSGLASGRRHYEG